MNDNKAPYCSIRRTLRQLQELDLVLAKDHDLSLDEAILLCCLSQNCKCQGDIAGETGLTAVQASRILSRLENKKLIERSIGEGDRRQMIFSLRPEGKRKLELVTPLGIEFLEQ